MKKLTHFKQSKIFRNTGVLIFSIGLFIQTNAQSPLWLTAFGTEGGVYNGGSGINAGSDGNIYLGYRYCGTVKIGVTGHSVSPAVTGNTSTSDGVGAGKLSNTLSGYWASQTQYTGGAWAFDYIMGAGLDPDLNSYTGGIVNSGWSGDGWFCAKTDVSGNLIWNIKSTSASGYASGMCGGDNHHTFICGTVGAGTNMSVLGHSITSNTIGGDYGWVLKVNSAGQIDTYGWLVPMFEGAVGEMYPDKCELDHSGHLWVYGGYSKSATLGTFVLPTSAGTGAYNLFVAEMDTATGNILQVFTAANAGSSSPWAAVTPVGLGGMAIDANDNVYITAPFINTATWGTLTATSASGINNYVAKLQKLPGGSTNYAWQWVQTFLSPNSGGGGYSVTIDKNQDVLVTGSFNSSVTVSGNVLTGSASSFVVAKYASGDGSLVYAMSANGGTSGITTDANRYTYVTGSYGATGISLATSGSPIALAGSGSSSSPSIFVAKLDSSAGISIVPNQQLTYCAGQTYSLPYTAAYNYASGTFLSGNTFTAELSDATGSFASGGTAIGTLADVTSGSISITIPSGTVSGGKYLLRIESSKPAYCSIVQLDTISISSAPAAPVASGNSPLCSGSSLNLNASTVTGATYSWTGPNSFSSSSQDPGITTITGADAGTYSVTATVGGCTSAAGTIGVSIAPAPTVTITGKDSVCTGIGTTLNASGGTSYTWSGGIVSTTSSIAVTPLSTTTYSLSVSSGTCSTDTAVVVTVTAQPTHTNGITQQVCQGVSLPLTTSGGTTYSWMPATGLSSANVANPVVNLNNTTTYVVTVANGSCATYDSVTVNVNALPVGAAVGTATIITGQSTALGVTNAGTGNTYTWSPANTLSCNTCANPVATPTVNTWYRIDMVNASGCNIEDSVLVTVKESCGPVYVPTAFSPNGDGSNDVFKVMGNCIKDMDLVVFDRWGNKVFESTNPAAEWDGTFKGQALNTGTYVFTLHATDMDNNNTNKIGNITIMR